MTVLLTPLVPTCHQVIDYFYHRRGEMIDLLTQLVKVESPSTVPAAQASVLSILDEALRGRGFHVRRIPGGRSGGQLLAVPCDRKSHQPLQLLLGHCDTVWPLGTLEAMPLIFKQGKAYGPGIYDMKAGLVQMLFAVEICKTQSHRPDVAPVIFINSDEEIGSRDSTPHIRRLARIANRAFVMEPSLGPSGKLKTARKGVGHFQIKVKGKAAHAGLDPEKGASAILELSFVIQKLFELNDPQRGITVNVGNIDGGIRPNVVAPESEASVDVRVRNAEDARQIEAQILSLQPTILGTQLIIQGRIGRPPMEPTPGNRQLWQLAQDAAEVLNIPLEEATAGGGSDGNTTSLFTPTLDGLGAVGDNAHAAGEYIYLDPLIERTALLAHLLLRPPLSSASYHAA